MQRLTWMAMMVAGAAALGGCSSEDGAEQANDFEGDEPGECNDGADNDRDGAYDCDDPDCAGAPNCGGSGGGLPDGGGNVTWQQIASGGVHNCGVTSDGEVLCWGNDAQGQSSPPSGTFAEARVSFFHSCAVDAAGALSCWGCKGDRDYGQCEVPAGLSDVAHFDAGTYASCAVDGDGVATCWGCNSADHGQCDPPDEVFDDLAAGSLHVCGLVAGAANCWGNDDYGQTSAPAGDFSQLTAGTWHSCGVGTDDSIQCWGCTSPAPDSPADFGQCDAPSGSFKQVAAGVYHTCGLKTDGTIACWGCIGTHDGTETDAGQCDPPAGTFEAIGVGKYHGCALEADGGVVCWGNDYYGQLAVP